MPRVPVPLTWRIAGRAMPAVPCLLCHAVALVTNVRNFTHHRGQVVGVIKASVGLSAALYTGGRAGAGVATSTAAGQVAAYPAGQVAAPLCVLLSVP